MMELVLATRNRKKVIELRQILAGLPLRLRTMDDFPDVPDVLETGMTFEENAKLKATAVARATGCWSLADDSGLVVDAIDGRPGVHSARYAGPGATDADNRRRLLGELAGVGAEARGARFVCVVAVASPGGDVRFARGECEGVILTEERGTGGFGYDPLFWLEPLGRTMAELPPGMKHRVSHRGRALEGIGALLASELERR